MRAYTACVHDSTCLQSKLIIIHRWKEVAQKVAGTRERPRQKDRRKTKIKIIPKFGHTREIIQCMCM